jgi:hypothetical protein
MSTATFLRLSTTNRMPSITSHRSAHVHTCGVAMLRVRCARAASRVATLHRRCARVRQPHRNATSPVCTCAPAVSQRYIGGMHVCASRIATLHRRCACARLPCRNATPPVRTCTPAVSQRPTRGAQVCAQGCAVLHLGVCLRCPLTTRLNRPIPYRYEVEGRRISGFGGCQRYGRAG